MHIGLLAGLLEERSLVVSMAFYDEFDPTDEQRGPNIAPRVEDYLNDKIQNAVDLEGIDVLLDGVLKQQHLLKQQVKMFPLHESRYSDFFIIEA